jgi:hypothetical protein
MLSRLGGVRRIKQNLSPAGPRTTTPRSSSPQPCHLNLFVKYLQRSQNIEYTFLFVSVAKSSTVVKHFALGMMMAKFDTSCGVFAQHNLHKVFVRFPLQKPQLKRSYWYRPSEISRAIVRRLARIYLVTTESRRALSSCTETVLNNGWGFQDEIPAPRN